MLKRFENVSPFDKVQISSKFPDYKDLAGSNTTFKLVPLTLELATF